MEMAEETQTRENQGSRRGAPSGRNERADIKMLVPLLLVACYMVGAAAGVYLGRQRAAPAPQQGLTYEVNMVSGSISGRTRKQRQKELDSVVEESMLAMSVNVTPSGKTAGADCSIDWMIENPSSQGKLTRVEVTRDDIGGKIFGTGAIRLGNYLESGPLSIPLLTGEYDRTVVFLAYQEETEALMGQAVVKIKPVLQE